MSTTVSLTGHFEISEDSVLIAEGTIISGAVMPTIQPRSTGSEAASIQLSKNDVYQALRIRGYEYGPNFQVVEKVCPESK